MWIAHLVHELLRHGRYGDASARAGVLGDDEGSVGTRFDQRVADIGQIRYRSPVVETVSPGALGAALDDVASDDSRSELIPALRAPPKLVTEWRHGQRGIGRATRNHDVGSRAQRLDYRFGAYVSVRRQHSFPD